MFALSPALTDALSAEVLRYAWLVTLPGQVPLHWTTHDHRLTVEGQDYTSIGRILSLPSFPRYREVRQHTITLTLSGVDQDLVTHLDGAGVLGGACLIDLVLLSEAGQPIEDTKIHMYAGTLDSWTFDGGGSIADAERIQLKINGPWVKPGKTSGRLTTDNSQQDYASGDRFMEFAHENEENLPWGAKRLDT